jgi:hypothetical protein
MTPARNVKGQMIRFDRKLFVMEADDVTHKSKQDVQKACEFVVQVSR